MHFFIIIFSLSSLITHRPVPKHSSVLCCVDYRNATQSFPKFKCFYFLYIFVYLGRRRHRRESGILLHIVIKIIAYNELKRLEGLQ